MKPKHPAPPTEMNAKLFHVIGPFPLPGVGPDEPLGGGPGVGPAVFNRIGCCLVTVPRKSEFDMRENKRDILASF